jgi:uncharacterized protein DUF4412
MKLIPLGLALLSTAFVAPVSAATFEGIVQMKVTDASKTTPIQYQVKDGLVRIDLSDPKGRQVSVIMDTANQKMIMIMTAQHMYMTVPMRGMGQPPAMGQSAAPSGAPMSAAGGMPVKTGETKTILGYTCTKYQSQSNGSTVEMWVTDELGNFAGLGSGGPGGRGQPPAWQQALAGHGFFPMLVTGTSSSGKAFSLEVTSVEKQSLDDSVFAPPAGFQDLGNMGGMMGGMMGGQRP